MTTIRLNNELEKKLKVLTSLEKTTKTEIIRKAISEYFKNHASKTTPYELGKDFFGKNGNENAPDSDNYKNKLKGKLNEKHSH